MTASKQFFYETIADEFDDLMNPFDVQRRLEIVFEQFLPGDLSGLSVLDVGCGTGRFSQGARARGAEVVAVDLGASLLRQVLKKAPVHAVVADGLRLPFGNDCFDIVISSEMIEHTPSPADAIREMARVLKYGGRLALTCPNRVWLWPVRLATAAGLRPFHGFENFPSFDDLRAIVADSGLRVQRHIGLHAWPFQIRPLWRASRAVDRSFGDGPWARLMINQAVLAVKTGRPGP